MLNYSYISIDRNTVVIDLKPIKDIERVEEHMKNIKLTFRSMQLVQVIHSLSPVHLPLIVLLNNSAWRLTNCNMDEC